MKRCISALVICLALIVDAACADEPKPADRSGNFDPWRHHQQLVENAKPQFAFDDDTDFERWQLKLRRRLLDVLAVRHDKTAPLKVSIAPERSTDEYDLFRVVYQAAPGVDVPCFLLKPKDQPGPLPVMICLQGHKKKDGMLVSIGRVPDGGGRDIAIQAVHHGWAALAVEQRCFGERKGDCQ